MGLTASEIFRKRLALLRKVRHLTQRELENRIGKVDTEAGYISRIETGRIVTPPFEIIDKIVKVLDVKVDEMFFGEGLDQDAERLRQSISKVAASQKAVHLRKIYRLILVYLEKYPE
jgi:transcriptional regulator with XRE-family HTH domain